MAMTTVQTHDWRAQAANQTRLAFGQALLEVAARDPKAVVLPRYRTCWAFGHIWHATPNVLSKSVLPSRTRLASPPGWQRRG